MMNPTLQDSGQRWSLWLHDRGAHRRPIDAHFADAIGYIAGQATNREVDVFELGPGPERDLRRAVGEIDGATYQAGDVHVPTAVETGVVNLAASWGEEWNAERLLPYRAGAFDVILAREVFEHVFHLRDMLLECRRILRPGGRLWFSTVFIFPLHDYETGDYWRISPTGWKRLMDDTGFVEGEIKPVRQLFGSWQTPISILGWGQK